MKNEKHSRAHEPDPSLLQLILVTILYIAAAIILVVELKAILW